MLENTFAGRPVRAFRHNPYPKKIMSILNRKEVRRKIHRRIRKKVSGTADCPRLAVHYSNKNLYAQVIDDVAGRTLCAASSLDKEVESSGSNVATAEKHDARVYFTLL